MATSEIKEHSELSELRLNSRKLQRSPDFTGDKLDRFRHVLFRHGLPGAILGMLCLLLPQSQRLLQASLTGFEAAPIRYSLVALVICIALTAYAAWVQGRFRLAYLGWVLYLGVLSLWEEWVFRVALPYSIMEHGVSFAVAVVFCSLLFGALHYFTLRWRWQLCVGAFFGGLLLSRQMEQHFDLLWITALHWIGTLLNTPRSPGSRSDSENGISEAPGIRKADS